MTSDKIIRLSESNFVLSKNRDTVVQPMGLAACPAHSRPPIYSGSCDVHVPSSLGGLDLLADLVAETFACQ